MLSAHQQRTLEEIEKLLRHSDSWLVSRFSLFAELVADEEMPRQEELPVTLRARAARLCRFPGWAPQDTGTGSPLRAFLLVPLLLLVPIICMVLLVVAPHGSAGCTRPPRPGSVTAGQLAPGEPVSWTGCPPGRPAARGRHG